MDYHHLESRDVEYNEVRTDVMACLIGFSKVLADGYSPVERTVDQKTIEKRKIGYIDRRDILDVSNFRYDFVMQHKDIEEKFKTRAERVSEVRQKIQNSIDAALYYDQCLTNVNYLEGVVRTSEAIANLQNVLCEYEQSNVRNEVQCIKGNFASTNDIDTICKVAERIDKICRIQSEFMYRIKEFNCQ